MEKFPLCKKAGLRILSELDPIYPTILAKDVEAYLKQLFDTLKRKQKK